jgi:hypothetical protein
MRKAERGVGSGRSVWIVFLSGLGVALAGCGGSDSGSATAATSQSTSSTSTTVADTTPTTSAAPSASAGTSASSSPTVPAATPTPTTVSTSVTLAWVPPTENSNGTPITNLAGYKIHYGTASADYTQTVSVANAGLTRYVVDNLPSGTYYFAITAYNASGTESALSQEVATTVN